MSAVKAGRFPTRRLHIGREMVYAAVLLIYGPSVLNGQFGDLATTDDGSTLYFASAVRPTGSSLSLHSKIYRWTTRSGVLVFAEEASERFDGCVQQFFYELHAPQVSADGGITAYTGTRPSSSGKFCPPEEPNEAVISLADNHSLKLPGAVALSRNGRYAITVPMDAQTDEYHLVTDLTTGQTSVVYGAFNGEASHVTDAGAVISAERTAIVVAERDGRTRMLQTQQAVDGAVIDRTGRTIVYTTQLGPSNPARIAAVDGLTGKETQLAVGFAFGILGISADGATVYYTESIPSNTRVEVYVYAIDTAGVNRQTVIKIQDPVTGAVMSGDGRVVFASSGGRLLRFDTVSGAVTEIVPPTPNITVAYRVGLPLQTTVAPVGSVMVLWGSRNGKEASVCGLPAALLDSSTFSMPSVRFQVPWDLAEGPCVVVVRTDSPFESGISLEVRKYDPQFANPLYFYHENFTGFIAASSPARAGEVISFYMTGLGPVDAAGMVSASFGCKLNFSTAELLYVGLAPGQPGFYQVNLRVPPDASGSAPFTAAPLVCGFNADLQAVASLWVR